MMRISAVEFSINLISSAIWAQFIVEVEDYYLQNINYLSTPIHVIRQTFPLVTVFVGLTYFNIRSSYWYHSKNVRQAKELETEVNGVMPCMKTSILKKKVRSQPESNQFNANVESPRSQTKRNIMKLEGYLHRKGADKFFFSSKKNVLDSNQRFGTKQHKSTQNSQKYFTGVDSQIYGLPLRHDRQILQGDQFVSQISYPYKCIFNIKCILYKDSRIQLNKKNIKFFSQFPFLLVAIIQDIKQLVHYNIILYLLFIV
uniref:Uncharacterized protein n=1 Tax=Spironucleus salmonicida TaxID=348837 RepID=V6LWX5_9EUKA|eukprot:EST49090.1 Hypothetical protein SS50377_10642 [Spironucleus salmonicida]